MVLLLGVNPAMKGVGVQGTWTKEGDSKEGAEGEDKTLVMMEGMEEGNRD